jgi:predicted nucleic acid-binding protein
MFLMIQSEEPTSFPAISGALDLIFELKPALTIVVYDDSVREEAERVFRILIRDKKLSFRDAISFVVARTILNDVACLSF